MSDLVKRILRLEELSRQRTADKARVVFNDGSIQYLPLPDCIEILKSPDSGVADISGDDDPGSGLLLRLLRDLI